jgi:FkbM family methyltransferase
VAGGAVLCMYVMFLLHSHDRPDNIFGVFDRTEKIRCSTRRGMNPSSTGSVVRRSRHSCVLKRRQGSLSRNALGSPVGLSDDKRFDNSFLSQDGEDEYLLENFFFMEENGTFIEMGALDGIRYSNSYFFEKVLGWSGVLIEAHPSKYRELVKNRGNVSTCVHGIVCDDPRDVHFVQSSNAAVGGVWELMSPAFRGKWHSNVTEADVQALPVTPCTKMQSILDRTGLKHVDFFSLDVEGAESSVLGSIDFSQFVANVFLIEYRQGQEDVRQNVHKILTREGYIFYSREKTNLVYVHSTFH